MDLENINCSEFITLSKDSVIKVRTRLINRGIIRVAVIVIIRAMT
jgi:hypothetical protein